MIAILIRTIAATLLVATVTSALLVGVAAAAWRLEPGPQPPPTLLERARVETALSWSGLTIPRYRDPWRLLTALRVERWAGNPALAPRGLRQPRPDRPRFECRVLAQPDP
jgi:hypothetical protein